jgi:hypothetical protein
VPPHRRIGCSRFYNPIEDLNHLLNGSLVKYLWEDPNESRRFKSRLADSEQLAIIKKTSRDIKITVDDWSPNSNGEFLAEKGNRLGLAVASGGLFAGVLDSYLHTKTQQPPGSRGLEKIFRQESGRMQAHEVEQSAIHTEARLDRLVGGGPSGLTSIGEVSLPLARAGYSEQNRRFASSSLCRTFEDAYRIGVCDGVTHFRHGEEPGNSEMPSEWSEPWNSSKLRASKDRYTPTDKLTVN